jgi:hypothetical protein
MIRRLTLNLTASGSDGSATASETTTSRLHGILKAVYINHSSGAATTDFTLAGTDPARTIMTKANSVTDAWFYPSVERTGADGAGLTAYADVSLNGDKLTASLAEANDDQTAAVTIIWDDLR